MIQLIDSELGQILCNVIKKRNLKYLKTSFYEKECNSNSINFSELLSTKFNSLNEIEVIGELSTHKQVGYHSMPSLSKGSGQIQNFKKERGTQLWGGIWKFQMGETKWSGGDFQRETSQKISRLNLGIGNYSSWNSSQQSSTNFI